MSGTKWTVASESPLTPKPLATHSLRQSPRGEIHLVLHLDRIQLRISFAEKQADACPSLAAGGADALKPLKAIELLLEDCRHALFDDVRSRCGERGTNAHTGWCQCREILQAEPGEGRETSQQNQLTTPNLGG